MICAALIISSATASAHRSSPSNTPHEIFSSKAWSVAVSGSKHDKICYSYTRALPQKAGAPRQAILSVADRPDIHDEVAITGDLSLSNSSNSYLSVGKVSIPLINYKNTLFSKDSEAAIKTFIRGRSATLIYSPHHKQLVFSLVGFGDAYKALRRYCTH